MVEFVKYWADRSELKRGQLVRWLGISLSKYYDWGQRQGQENQHNGQLPKENWLAEWEQEAIKQYYQQHPQEGYRRLAYMMLDEEVVAVSPSSVYRVLSEAELLKRWASSPSRKGTGFVQPSRPHQHWHIDITYVRMASGFMYLTAIIDWYSRYVLAWQLSNSLDNHFCLVALEQALARTQPEIFNTDQGVQFTANSFTDRLEAAHIRISMDGRGRALDNIFVERLWRTIKYEHIYLHDYTTVAALQVGLTAYFNFYNNERFHQSLDYRTPVEVHYA